jgi:hypothetical protein
MDYEDYAKISEEFMKQMKRMGKMHYGDEQLYLQGMIDICDAIAAIHPEQVYDMFKLREAIENAIDARDEAEEKANE